MSDYRIPFNRPASVGKELSYLGEAVASPHHAGDGPFTRRCTEFLERELGVEQVLLTTSCTHALEMSSLLLDLGPGDEFIVPSFAFVTTAGAFALRGARPVFADIRSDTFNLDESRLQALVTPRTRAIVALHYGGIGCEMDAIMEVATANRIQVVEDNAHGLFGSYRGRPLGSMGAAATQSFHETKNFSCGEGGAIVLNREDWRTRAEIIREKGTDRSRFFRGEVDRYSWVDVGSSYLLSDLLAAHLWAQLEARDEIQSRRRRIWTRYAEELPEWAEGNDVALPTVPDHCVSAFHVFSMMMPTLASRQGLIAHLRERGILAVFHYLPLHLSQMGRRYGGRPGDCPVAEDVSERLVRLPLFAGLTEDEQTEVIETVQAFAT